MGFVDCLPRVRARAIAGFTLVEVLVVLLVLGIAAGAAVVAYTGDERDSTMREARLLAGAVEHAALRAKVRAETLGVAAEGDTWRFWRRHPDSGRWQPVADDDVLAARALPPRMAVVALAYAGAPVAGDAIVPLRPTGRNEPYVFVLRSPATTVVLASDPLNRVTLSATDTRAAP